MVELNTAAHAFCHSSERLSFGDFTLDLRAGQLCKGSAPIRLPPQQFTILAALVRTPGALVTRDELRDLLWGHDAYVDFDAGLNFSIRQLRLALGDNAGNPIYIQTLPRRGYRFIAGVTRLESVATDAMATSPGNQPEGARWMPAALAVMTLVVVGLSLAYGSLAMNAAAPALPHPDTRIADAHAAHGFVALNDRWDWTEAERAFGRSLQLDPNQEVALISLSRLYASQGRFDQALAFARRAVDAHPSSTRAAVTLGWAQLFAGNAEGARATCGQALAGSRTAGPARNCEMAAEAELGVDHAVTWRRSLDAAMQAVGPVSWFHRATLQARLGQRDAALDSLRRALAAREPDATFALVHPALITLRATPAFIEVTAAAGLKRFSSEISAISH